MMDLASTVARLVKNSTLSVPPGTYAGDVVLKAPGCTIRAQPGTVTLRGGAFGIRILDGTVGTVIDGLNFSGQAKNAVYVKALCHRTTIQNCRITGTTGSGILTANAHDVVIRQVTVEDSADHGIYASQSGDRGQIVECVCRRCAASAIQCNAHDTTPGKGQRPNAGPDYDGISDRWLIHGNLIEGSGQRGGSGINLLGVTNSTVSDNTIRGQKGGGGIAIDADGGGGKPCYGLILQRNHVSAPHHGILIGKGSLACTVDASNQIVGNPQTDYREHVKTT